MSTFFENWKQCMQGNGLPIPKVEDATEALHFLEQLHQAWENSGGEVEMTIGALASAGGAGLSEEVLIAIGVAADVVIVLYINQGIGCLSSVALDELKRLFADNELPEFVVAELDNKNISLANDEAIA